MSMLSRTENSRNSSDPSSDFDPGTRALEDITGDYVIDPIHSRIGFRARHAMVTSVRGAFGAFDGRASVDTLEPSRSRVTLSIDVASLETGNADRDGHLRSGDFFDVAAFPAITFASTAVARAADSWTVSGDLTIKGVAQPITLVLQQMGSAKDHFETMRVGFEGETWVSRKEWGLTWNVALDTGGVLVSDKIKLEFDISAVKVA